jgi:hypothetical protein
MGDNGVTAGLDALLNKPAAPVNAWEHYFL